MSPDLGCVNIPSVVKNLSFLFIILLISGCSSSKKILVSDSLDGTPVISGSVVDLSSFQKGGSLGLGLFKAGSGAAADDETDQLSFMMIKGIKDTLPQDNTPFNIATDAQKDPDLYLDGHIDDYGRKGHSAHLSVDGEIWLQESGEKVFLFQTSIVINLKTQNPKTVAYQIGVAIAHFISAHAAA